jgi:hypothetical protein
LQENGEVKTEARALLKKALSSPQLSENFTGYRASEEELDAIIESLRKKPTLEHMFMISLTKGIPEEERTLTPLEHFILII